MQTDDANKIRPVVVRKKGDGWREREEAKAARVAPRALVAEKHDSAESTLVLC